MFDSLMSEVVKLSHPKAHSVKPKNKAGGKGKELTINATSYHGHYTALKRSNLYLYLIYITHCWFCFSGEYLLIRYIIKN